MRTTVQVADEVPSVEYPEDDWRPIIDAGGDSTRQQQVQEAVDVVNDLRRDPAFRRQVARQGGFFASWHDAYQGEYYTGQDVAAFVFGYTPEGSRIVVRGDGTMTSVGDQRITLSASHEGLIAPCMRGPSFALVNTLIHEFTHLIPDRAGRYRFRDRIAGWRRWRHLAVSYQVGNIAQCYLVARAEGVRDDDLDAKIDACRAPDHLDRLGKLVDQRVCPER